MMSRFSFSALWASVPILFTLLTVGCGPAVVEDSAPPVRPAKLVKVEQASKERLLTFPAIFDAQSSAVLKFPQSGTLQEILVKGGDEVEEGAIIARLDPRVFRNQMLAAKNQFDEAQTEFDRASRLLAADAIAQSVYDQRETVLEVARAAYDDAKKALEDTVLTAPFAGVIAERHLDENQNVSAGEAIVTVQTTGAVDAIIDVPSALVANSNLFEPIETVVLIDVRPDLRINAEINEMSAKGDAATQTFELRFSFTPPEDLIVLPGMTGTVEARIAIISEDYASEVVVPIAAVVSDGASEYVWRVDDDSLLVSRQDIETGRRVGETVIVISGVAKGDTIVGAGASYLNEGTQVRPYNP